MKEKIKIQDATLIGKWDEVKGVPLSSITKKDSDTDVLDGIIIKGYETKFNVKNENNEKYDPHCLDKFVQSYFVDNRLNMVVDVQHSWAVDDQVGRVIYLEVNSVGFYFVAYIPRSVKRYEQIKYLLKEGILQGFSKMGWATEYEWRYKENGDFDYFFVKEMAMTKVSLVTDPANPIPFEAVGETIKDGLEFRNRLKDEARPKKKSILKSKNNIN